MEWLNTVNRELTDCKPSNFSPNTPKKKIRNRILHVDTKKELGTESHKYKKCFMEQQSVGSFRSFQLPTATAHTFMTNCYSSQRQRIKISPFNGSIAKKPREGASAYLTVVIFCLSTKGRELIFLQLLIKSAMLSLPLPIPHCRRCCYVELTTTPCSSLPAGDLCLFSLTHGSTWPALRFRLCCVSATVPGNTYYYSRRFQRNRSRKRALILCWICQLLTIATLVVHYQGYSLQIKEEHAKIFL